MAFRQLVYILAQFNTNALKRREQKVSPQTPNPT